MAILISSNKGHMIMGGVTTMRQWQMTRLYQGQLTSLEQRQQWDGVEKWALAAAQDNYSADPEKV